MVRRPPRSTLFPYTSSSDLLDPALDPGGPVLVHGCVLPVGRREEPTQPPVQRRCCTSAPRLRDRKSTRLNSSHSQISYAVFCLRKKKTCTNASIPIFADQDH